MNRLLFFFLAISFSFVSISQDYDEQMINRQIDCSDISNNSAAYFMRYMHDYKLDSAENILNYWRRRCGLKEPLHRARIIHALERGSYADSLLTSYIIDYIFIYQDRQMIIEQSAFHVYDQYQTYFGYIPPGESFDNFTQLKAMKLKERYAPHSTEHLLCEFYGNNSDTIFDRLQSGDYNTSQLYRDYEREINKYKDKSEFHISLITGVWIPTGELKAVGIHPELGFQMGAKYKKMNYDFVLVMKFVKSPEPYYARDKNQNDSLVLTDHFLGGHIGVDVGRDIFVRKGHEIQITGGLAYDGFDVIESDEDQDIKSSSASSYNISIGLGYRYYLTNSFYLGIRSKYNIVDYTLNGVVDYSGNPVTIQFIIGGVSNKRKENSLKALNYKGLRR